MQDAWRQIGNALTTDWGLPPLPEVEEQIREISRQAIKRAIPDGHIVVRPRFGEPTHIHGEMDVFVAMPFAEEFEDVYEFGIYEPVRKCGYICERVDETHFAGDILQRIKDRIQAAKFVLADLTGGRPNVYLEVGYAWGQWQDEPGEQPPFARGLVHVNGAEAREHTELLASFNRRAESLRRATPASIPP